MAEKKQEAWLAVKEKSIWDKNEQMAIFGTWKDIVKLAYRKSEETGKEVRVSDTAGFNNQGHYFSKS